MGDEILGLAQTKLWMLELSLPKIPNYPHVFKSSTPISLAYPHSYILLLKNYIMFKVHDSFIHFLLAHSALPWFLQYLRSHDPSF